MRKSKWIKQDRLEFHKKSFFNKVYPEPNTGCWIWAGAETGYGYGSLKYGPKMNYAHRFSYFIHKGDFDKNLSVLHVCDNRFCVNPDHLFLGTYQDNCTDKINKGRANNAKGEKTHSAKLNESQVLIIRAMNREGISQHELARSFGVNQRAIWAIVHRLNWRHI